MNDFEKKSINEKFLKNRLKLNKKTQKENFQKFLYDRLKPNPKHTILDLGCGHGQTSLSIIRKSKYKAIYSVDINKLFINKLKPLKKKYKKFYPLVGSMDTIKFRVEKFDLIIISYCIYYSKNYKYLLEKLIRILKKGGRIIIANPYKPHFMVNFVSKIHSLNKKIYESLNCSDTIYSFVLQKSNVTANKIFFTNETVLTKRDILDSYINSTMYNLHKVDLVKSKIRELKKRKFKFTKKTCLIEIKKKIK